MLGGGAEIFFPGLAKFLWLSFSLLLSPVTL